MSPYASIALLALVLSVAAQNQVKTTVDANVNWHKQSNSGVGNVNVNGKATPFTFSVTGGPNQPTFTVQSQNQQGKTATVQIIPIKPITAPLPIPGKAPKPAVGHDVPVPIPSAAPVPRPTTSPSSQPNTSPKPVVTVKTSTFTAASSEPSKPTVTIRSQTITNSNEPNKPVTVTVVSVARPASEPVRLEPVPVTVDPSLQGRQIPIPSPVPTPPPFTYDIPVDCEIRENRHNPECRDRHEDKKRRKGCNRKLWIKGCIIGLAAFGALALLALCCRLCRGGRCCRRCHRECERNPTYGIPAPVPMQLAGQPQVLVVQAQPVNDPFYQPQPASTNRSAQPFVQLNETQPDTSANYVIGYPQASEQPIYLVPQRN